MASSSKRERAQEARARAAAERFQRERSIRLAIEREARRQREEDRRAVRGYPAAWAPERRAAAGLPEAGAQLPPREAAPLSLPPSTSQVDLQPLPGGGRGKGFWSFGRAGLDARPFPAAASIFDQWNRSGLGRAGAIPEARVTWKGYDLGPIPRDTWKQGPRAIAAYIRSILPPERDELGEEVGINIPPESWDYPEEG